MPSPARADERHNYADIVCRENSDGALIRFTTQWSDDPPAYRRLPVEVDSGLSATPPAQRRNCTMGNGWKVRIRTNERQAFAYGYGGADPPAFFSLWIEQRKVLSREQWKPGYGDDKDPWLVAVVLRPDRLTYCRVGDGSDAPQKGKISCSGKPLRLSHYAFDRIEYGLPGSRSPVGTMLVLPGSRDPKVCRQYLRTRRNSLPEAYGMVDSAKIFGQRLETSLPYSVAEGFVDLGRGIRRKLIHWSAEAGYLMAT